jgi:hypothetical protein
MQLAKYFLIVILASILVVASASWIVNKGLSRSHVDFFGKLNAAEDTTTHTNLLLVGSSRILMQANPSVFDSITGLRSYNFGLNAGTIKTCYNVIRYALHFQKKVKAVVLNIDYYMFDISHDPYKDAYYYAFENKASGLLFNDSGKTRILHRLRFLDVSLYDDFVKYAAIDGWLRPNRVVSGQFKGYFPHQTVNDFEPPKDEPSEKVRAPFSETGIRILKDCFDLCRQNDVKLVLVLAPYYKQWAPEKYYSNFHFIIDRVKETARQHGIPFYDYTPMELSGDRSCFYNVNHLNRKGATRYSAAVADSLKNYLLSLNGH